MTAVSQTPSPNPSTSGVQASRRAETSSTEAEAASGAGFDALLSDQLAQIRGPVDGGQDTGGSREEAADEPTPPAGVADQAAPPAAAPPPTTPQPMTEARAMRDAGAALEAASGAGRSRQAARAWQLLQSAALNRQIETAVAAEADLAAQAADSFQALTAGFAGAAIRPGSAEFEQLLAEVTLQTEGSGGGDVAAAGAGETELSGLPDAGVPPGLSPTLDLRMAGDAPRTLAPGAPLSPAGANFAPEVAERLHWMVDSGVQKAEIVLDPPELGRIEIRLRIEGEHTEASFYSANPVVRESLEAALPRLRDALGEAGLQLGQASVGGEAQRQAQEPWARPGGLRNATNGDGLAAAAAESTRPRTGRGLVDLFA